MCSFPLYLANLFEGLTERKKNSFTVSQLNACRKRELSHYYIPMELNENLLTWDMLLVNLILTYLERVLWRVIWKNHNYTDV